MILSCSSNFFFQVYGMSLQLMFEVNKVPEMLLVVNEVTQGHLGF